MQFMGHIRYVIGSRKSQSVIKQFCFWGRSNSNRSEMAYSVLERVFYEYAASSGTPFVLGYVHPTNTTNRRQFAVGILIQTTDSDQFAIASNFPYCLAGFGKTVAPGLPIVLHSLNHPESL